MRYILAILSTCEGTGIRAESSIAIFTFSSALYMRTIFCLPPEAGAFERNSFESPGRKVEGSGPWFELWSVYWGDECVFYILFSPGTAIFIFIVIIIIIIIIIFIIIIGSIP